MKHGDSKDAAKSLVDRRRLSSVDGAHRKRLLYFGLLAAATLAVTAFIIVSSGSSQERGAAGATGLDETENPWPTAEERRLTREEDNYIYARPITTSNEPATDTDVNPSAKRTPPKARKRRRGGKVTVSQRAATTTTTMATTAPPEVPTVSSDDSSEKREQPHGGPDADREDDKESGSQPAPNATPRKRTRKPARPAHDGKIQHGTKSTHKKKQATPGGDDSRTE
ncbi:uncharacterized protein LOC119372376 [Rhipicephalus sanguineus]|uniref:uncharacterized protein LOC119372376 n=1 Tax=Rhipicephalus sanguineus TaxID=34632 RepID=UPI0020C1ED4A|nr:uncharacterized protein LOC119372376 [Rhipicephalus sanguineus]